jgi:uncharacterized protein YyaL (SSP411 family)
MPQNRLAAASSPYLLQHAGNPVDWWEWGDDAFAEARRRDAPILLSVGYAACHWCHVMAHESFEDPATAELMNRWFVNIKVDREERPDVDRVYMDAVQATTGRGGWPMTVVLTPDGEPFFAGTYFPKTDRLGHPAFQRVLQAVRTAWEERRAEVVGQARRLTTALGRHLPAAERLPDQEVLRSAHDRLAADFDAEHGGFGGAPKFPQAPTLEFLLRSVGRPWAPRAADMLTVTLDAIASGGIYDHVGGGFSRYSVDAEWRVPHFEKMLYDNAMLARLYTRAWQVTGDSRYAVVATETLDYMIRDLALPDGGFASAEDADSEGEEGRFYLFGYDEFMAHAGDGAELAAAVFGITPDGDVGGRNVLRAAASTAAVAARAGVSEGEVAEAVGRARRNLRAVRSVRTRPALDDKAVTAWNGLAVRAFAEAGTAFGEERYLGVARETAEFLLTRLRGTGGRLLRSRRADAVSGPGFCDDYAAAALGLFALYAATGEARWFTEAASITEDLIRLFWDDEAGGFFATGRDAEVLITRPKNVYDGPTPSDNALGAEALLCLAAFTGVQSHLERVEVIMRNAGLLMESHPGGAGHFLALASDIADGTRELAIVGDPGDPATEALARPARAGFRPGLFVAVGRGDTVPLLRGRPTVDDLPTAYLCRDFACDAPTTDPEALMAALGPPVLSGSTTPGSESSRRTG